MEGVDKYLWTSSKPCVINYSKAQDLFGLFFNPQWEVDFGDSFLTHIGKWNDPITQQIHTEIGNETKTKQQQKRTVPERKKRKKKKKRRKNVIFVESRIIEVGPFVQFYYSYVITDSTVNIQ